MPKLIETQSDLRLQNWAKRLYQRYHIRVEVIVTQNRSSMIRITHKGRRYVVLRVHEAFMEAPDSILRDLRAVLVQKDPLAWKRVASFARNIPDQWTPGIPVARPLRSQGKNFDLAKRLDDVRRTYFTDDLEASITWGRYPRRTKQRRKRRSIIFASWHEDLRLIRVHPALDQSWVPPEFMNYLIYHELCHAAAPPRRGRNGKRAIHHAEFNQLENQFPNIQKMHQLCGEILNRISREMP